MKSKLMALFSALILLGFTAQGGAAQQQESENQKQYKLNPELLFIQTAEEAVITADPRTKDQYILTLRNVKPHIAYFADRPKRLAGKVSLDKFLARWSEEGERSFKSHHPQAAFVSSKSATSQQNKKAGELVALSRPKYNPRTKTLTYIVKPTSHRTIIKEGRHQNPVLFIDEMNWPGFF